MKLSCNFDHNYIYNKLQRVQLIKNFIFQINVFYAAKILKLANFNESFKKFTISRPTFAQSVQTFSDRSGAMA